jgi:DNA repair protein RadA/Sms
MTVEVQALVSFSAGSGAYGGRRVVDGISASRLLLILAVLQKRYGISFHRQDVYVNVVGGLHLGKGSKSGGGSDLSVVVAVVSSLLGIPVRSDTAFVGEIGLLGELRQVHSLEKRVSEARRMGFSRIVTPLSVKKSNINGPREISSGGITQIMCDNALDAINCGLVKSLPTIRTSSGPKLRRPKRQDQRLNTEILDYEDVILDDGGDDNF